jgi:hypothetical protein
VTILHPPDITRLVEAGVEFGDDQPAAHPHDALAIADPYVAIRYLHSMALDYRRLLHAALAVAAQRTRERDAARTRLEQVITDYRTTVHTARTEAADACDEALVQTCLADALRTVVATLAPLVNKHDGARP